MKNHAHYSILSADTILFLIAVFFLIPFPKQSTDWLNTTDPGLLATLNYGNTINGMISSIQNGRALAMAARIFSIYIGFVVLVLGHFKMVNKREMVVSK